MCYKAWWMAGADFRAPQLKPGFEDTRSISVMYVPLYVQICVCACIYMCACAYIRVCVHANKSGEKRDRERERFVCLQRLSLKIKQFSRQLIQSRDAAVLIPAVAQPVGQPISRHYKNTGNVFSNKGSSYITFKSINMSFKGSFMQRVLSIHH